MPMTLSLDCRNGFHLVAVLVLYLSKLFAKAQQCSYTTPCELGSSFCDFEYGNQGNCVSCSSSACLDSNMETRGVVDCFDSCHITSDTPSIPSCHGYILDRETYIPNQGPFPVPCDSKYGDSWMPYQYQQNSCCSGSGSYFVSQIGGFEAGYGSPGNFPICSAYVHALRGVLCDPQQGRYIRTYSHNNTSTETVLRICRESCDAVFANCGPPGEAFPEGTTYTDGTSLCKEMWGGFGAATPCDGRRDGYVCQSQLTIDIVDDDCLQMIFPSEKDIDHFKQEQGAPNPICSSLKRQRRIRTIIIPAIVGFIVAVLILLGICVCISCKQKHDTPHPGWADQDTATAIAVKVDTIPDEEKAHKHQTKYDNQVHAMDPPMAEALPVSIANNSINVSTDADGLATNLMQISSAGTKVPPIADFVGESQDKTRSVNSWFAAHPSTAASLTPEDVAAVLSNVSFSLEQPTISKLLAEGITNNGGSIYTTHVIAAMDHSALHQDADIAKQMAPYVIDPENKNQILSKLRSSFSKNEVSQCFKTFN